MKRIFFSFMALVCFAFSLAGRVTERVYVSTDRDIYLAGEKVWCSAFCLNGDGTASGVSAVAYLELKSSEETVQSAKISLTKGRGAGRFSLPGTLPTGNYTIIAYTALNKGEKGYVYDRFARKTISVFNTFSKERVRDGVKIIKDEEYLAPAAAVPEDGDVRISLSGRVLKLENEASLPVSLSVSVFHEDTIRHPSNPSAIDFSAALRREREVGGRAADYAEDLVAEYEGEVIHGHLAGVPESDLPRYSGKYAFISTPSGRFDIYAGLIDSAGRVAFHTGNIYGNCDLVCNIAGADSSMTGYIELESPFVYPRIDAPDPLEMARVISDDLKKRSFSMQVERRFAADTLYPLFRLRNNALLSSDAVRFILDDYTRFPTMKEVFTEFLHYIKVVGQKGSRPLLEVALRGLRGDLIFTGGRSLILLDGVPVTDHSKILGYDPLLVKEIDIYPYKHQLCDLLYDGIANFVTYKGSMPSYEFDASSRVAGFQGVSFPQAYTCEALGPESRYPDYRQTIYWNPLVEVSPGDSYETALKLPDYKGRFTVRVEGFSSSGEAILRNYSFAIE